MSGIVKLQRAAQAFELIPRALVQHGGVNQDGKFLAIWLACKPPGWNIHTAALRRELGWTKERFGKATRSLQSQGLWRHARVHKAGGQFEHAYTCLLEPEAGFPASGEPGAGEPDAGNPACIEETRKDEIREQQQHRAQRGQVVVFSTIFLNVACSQKMSKNSFMRCWPAAILRTPRPWRMNSLARCARAAESVNAASKTRSFS